MAENKNRFTLDRSWSTTLGKLTDEQAGKVIKWVFAFINDESPSEEFEDPVVDICVSKFKAELKQDLKKWQRIVDRNQENGAKGGRPPKKQKQKPQPLPEKPSETKLNSNEFKSIINDGRGDSHWKNRPSWDEFLSEAKKHPKYHKTYEQPLKDRFTAWVQNGWTISEKPIRDWKKLVTNHIIPDLEDQRIKSRQKRTVKTSNMKFDN